MGHHDGCQWDVCRRTCSEWMGMEQRPQLLRLQTASTVAALPNNMSRLSKSCWDTENKTWNRPLSANGEGRRRGG